MAGNDSFTKLLLHCDGADASTTFTDSSASGHTVTPSGNAQVDTAQSKFGGASLLLDGTGDYLTVADSTDWNFGTGAFTYDFWLRQNSGGTGVWIDSGDQNGVAFYQEAGLIRAYIKGNFFELGAKTFTAGQWYHAAFVRSGSSVYTFFDGVQHGSTGSNSSDITGPTMVRIGTGVGENQVPATRYWNGWMDEVRISNSARWTSDFTPPSAEYSADGQPAVKRMAGVKFAARNQGVW